MNQNNFSNIFNEGKSSRKIDKQAVIPSLKSFSQHAQPDISDAEIQSMLTRMRSIHDEIESQLETTYQKFGYDPNFIKSFVANPNNFNSDQWKRIQSGRKSFLHSIWSAIAEESQGIEELQEKYKKKALDKTAKERKGKLLGARRNWIPIR